jgi:hypothetical protein
MGFVNQQVNTRFEFSTRISITNLRILLLILNILGILHVKSEKLRDQGEQMKETILVAYGNGVQSMCIIYAMRNSVLFFGLI